MARLFDRTAQKYIASVSPPVTSAPLSISCWFYTTDDTNSQSTFGLLNTTSGIDYFILEPRGDLGDVFRFYVRSSAPALQSAQAANLFQANRWHHGCGVTSSSTSRYCYLDGIPGSENTGAVTPSGINQVTAPHSTNSALRLEGKLAELGIWNAALTDAEVKLLAMGLSPLLVRRQNLVFYAPLTYRSQDFDIVGRLNMTAYNSPSWAEHPVGITYPEPAPPMVKEQLPYFWTLPVVTEEEALSVQLNTLSAVLSAQGITMSPGEVAVMLNELSLTSSIEDIIVSLAGGTTFPFSDDWTGADFAEWNATKWTTVAG